MASRCGTSIAAMYLPTSALEVAEARGMGQQMAQHGFVQERHYVGGGKLLLESGAKS